MTGSYSDTELTPSTEYKAAREALVQAERSLRQQVEEVAAQRRALPPGPVLPTDYEFIQVPSGGGGASRIRLSELFRIPNRSLVLYSFMQTDDSPPCPMCTSFLDSFNGAALHASQQLNIGVVAKASASKLADIATARSWQNLPMLSSKENNYNADFKGEEGETQQPMLNVFQQTPQGIRHSYRTDLYFTQPEAGQHPRHMDMLFPLWNLFDLTQEGRPDNWSPSASTMAG